MTRRCSRCGITFQLIRDTDRYCGQCASDVAEVIRIDEARRIPRFRFAKELGRDAA